MDAVAEDAPLGSDSDAPPEQAPFRSKTVMLKVFDQTQRGRRAHQGGQSSSTHQQRQAHRPLQPRQRAGTGWDKRRRGGQLE